MLHFKTLYSHFTDVKYKLFKCIYQTNRFLSTIRAIKFSMSQKNSQTSNLLFSGSQIYFSFSLSLFHIDIYMKVTAMGKTPCKNTKINPIPSSCHCFYSCTPHPAH